MCGVMHIKSGAYYAQKQQSPGDGVIDCCELANMGDGS